MESWKVNLISVWFGCFFTGLAISQILPFLPLYVSQLGVTSQDVAGLLNSVVGGTAITDVRDSIYLVPIVGRAQRTERDAVNTLQDLQVPLSNGSVVPLLSFATIRDGLACSLTRRR